MVQNISEYANEIIEGQNEFLDYSSKLTMQLNKQTSNQIIISPSNQQNILEEKEIYSYEFKDSGGEFKYTVINQTHLKIEIIEYPNWSEISIDEHIGESISCIMESSK